MATKIMIEIREHWLDRAVEDRLGEIIDKYRSQGKDVHNVGALRKKVDADLNALRGTAAWIALKQQYDPQPTNKVAWCCVCDKPVARHSVSAWLEDKKGNVFCGQECRDNTEKHPISFTEYKRRVKEKGSMTSRRREIVNGEVVDGEEFTITYEQIRNIGPDIEGMLATIDTSDSEVDWTSDDSLV